jgi:hypothetical protein
MNFGEEKLSKNFTINALLVRLSPLKNFKLVGIEVNWKTGSYFLKLLQ